MLLIVYTIVTAGICEPDVMKHGDSTPCEHHRFSWSGMHTPIPLYAGSQNTLFMHRGGNANPYNPWHAGLTCGGLRKYETCVQRTSDPTACSLSMGLVPMPPHLLQQPSNN